MDQFAGTDTSRSRSRTKGAERQRRRRFKTVWKLLPQQTYNDAAEMRERWHRMEAHAHFHFEESDRASLQYIVEKRVAEAADDVIVSKLKGVTARLPYTSANVLESALLILHSIEDELLEVAETSDSDMSTANLSALMDAWLVIHELLEKL